MFKINLFLSYGYIIYVIYMYKKRKKNASRQFYLAKILFSIMGAILGVCLLFYLLNIFPSLDWPSFSGIFQIMIFVPISAIGGALVGFMIVSVYENLKKED